MVVAGPGTGKTQILALRIANILEKTDTHADGILCLTFTNSGVLPCERLRKYIGGKLQKLKYLLSIALLQRLLTIILQPLDFWKSQND